MCPPLPSSPLEGGGKSMSISLFEGHDSVMNHLLEERKGGKPFFLFISGPDHGKRLDQFLAGTELNLSRSQAKKWIEEKVILLNGSPTKPSAPLRAGDQVSGTLPTPEPLALEPEPLPLTILYEDPSIIVIDKPPGMVVHPAPGTPSGTLVNALIHHCTDLAGINGVLRPGIVHRLDKETSGVMVVAKDDGAYHHLVNQFKDRTVEKVYLTLARGHFSQNEGSIDLAIGRHPTERKRMSTRTRRGRPAVTQWTVLERFDKLTLLENLSQNRPDSPDSRSPLCPGPSHSLRSSLWKERSASGSDIKRMFQKTEPPGPPCPPSGIRSSPDRGKGRICFTDAEGYA